MTEGKEGTAFNFEGYKILLSTKDSTLYQKGQNFSLDQTESIYSQQIKCSDICK